MRGGRHFVYFSIVSSSIIPQVNLGVIRPVSLTDGMDLGTDWRGSVNPVFVSPRDQSALAEKLRSHRTAKWGDSNVHCCTYSSTFGRRYWTDWDNDETYSDWQGSEGLGGSGTIGLLLDLNEGNLSAFKNVHRLGVLRNGLDGEYCWFVADRTTCTISLAKGEAPK